MIAAGTVDTKIVGASLTASLRPGICFLTSAKFASAGSAANAGGSALAGVQGHWRFSSVAVVPMRAAPDDATFERRASE